MYDQLVETLLEDNSFQAADKFGLLQAVNKQAEDVQGLYILVAMRLANDQWDQYTEIASSLVRKSGLFPYLSHNKIGFKDVLAKEFYRSPSGRNSFMHRAQYEVLQRLLTGKSLILSAPTSFGKSFVIDELLLSNKYDNVLLIVPTIALIDETRRRISKLGLEHKIICFTGQDLGSKNVIILTQERALEMRKAITSLDLLIIDEFYKMDSTLSKDDSDRAGLLNVCYRIYESLAKQVYLLGPYIKEIAGYASVSHNPEIMVCNDNTTFIQHILKTENKDVALKSILLEEKKDSLLIYCCSQNEILNLYKKMIEQEMVEKPDSSINNDFANWIDANISPNWYVASALRMGIGVHHAKMPRFVSQEMIRRFNNGDLKILLCTSTIIEGVNTAAKSVVIYTQKRGSRKIDGFTFKNIAGRAGRMFKHFSGKVYYFEKPKETDDITVTDHVGVDEDGITAGLLSLLDEAQLTSKQTTKVEAHTRAALLPKNILRDNYFIDVEKQEEAYQYLLSTDSSVLNGIRSSHPSGDEIKTVLRALAVLGLNFKSIGRATTDENGIIRTTIFINAFLGGGIKGLAKAFDRNNALNDTSIEFAFDFMRNQLAFKLPKYIRALDRIQKVAYSNPGNLEPFANTIEFLNQQPVYIQLDELGMPVELSHKLHLSSLTLEAAMNDISSSNRQHLTPFEKEVVDHFIND